MSEEIPNVDVPEGKSGVWRVERFTVSADDIRLHNLRCAIKPGMGNRMMKEGAYTRLVRGSEIVMSDTHAEKRDHIAPVRMAKGVILLNGLGLGMVLNACLLKPEVEQAIVIEASDDVIALVADHYKGKFPGRVDILKADALDYQPPKGVRFGMVWHDIWDGICSDNLRDMTKLHRRYGVKADWQGSWCKELCKWGR